MRAPANPSAAAYTPTVMKSWLKLALMAGVAVVAVELYLGRLGGPTVPSGTPAPAFALPDTYGRTVSLEGLRGKVVAVNFWATWCGPCRAEMPDLIQVYATNKSKCFELLGIAEESGSRDQIVDFAQRLGVNYPILLDEQGRAGDAFRIQGYPGTFLIDVRGNVRKAYRGAIDREELERALAPLLAEAPATCPRA